MIVIKVGGSLFERSGLRQSLAEYLGEFAEPITLVAGGGESAEAVRTYDRIHALGEEQSHWLAVQSLAVTTGLLRHLTDNCYPVLDAVEFCERDQSLPHSWAVSTDSIAARFAEVSGASKLILLKSVVIPSGTQWMDAVRQGWVDDFFATIASRLTMPIEFVRLS